MTATKMVKVVDETERRARAVAYAVGYWVRTAREANRWRIELRREARTELRCRQSGRLYDESRRWRDRRDVFLAMARQVRIDLTPSFEDATLSGHCRVAGLEMYAAGKREPARKS